MLNGSAVTSSMSVAPNPVQARLVSLVDAPATILGDAATIVWRPLSAAPLWGRTGFDFSAPLELITLDKAGVRHLTLPEFGRLELRVEDAVTAGYLLANGTLRPLPPGSRLDPGTGTFTWAPGPGYVGAYDLVFLEGAAQIPLRVTIASSVR